MADFNSSTPSAETCSMLFLCEIDLEIQIHVLDEVVCISLCANALEKMMNLSVLPITQLWLNNTADKILEPF